MATSYLGVLRSKHMYILDRCKPFAGVRLEQR